MNSKSTLNILGQTSLNIRYDFVKKNHITKTFCCGEVTTLTKHSQDRVWLKATDKDISNTKCACLNSAKLHLLLNKIFLKPCMVNGSCGLS